MVMSAQSRNFRDSYVFSKMLGSGNFSLVRKVRHKFSRSMYAAKIVKLPASDENRDDYEDILEMVRDEVNVMRKLKHTNLLQFVDVFYAKDQIIVLTELTEHGDLQEFIQKKEEQLLEETARHFCLQIASAINYMHSMKLAHRDIKPENVLLFKDNKQDLNYTLKLCDFGLAEETKTLDGFTRVCGSPSYVAPEILEFKPYGIAVDIWSMGILFYLILCRYVPFDDIDMGRKFELIMNTKLEFPETEWNDISKEAKQLIGLMLERNPRRRIKASGVLYNKWFRRTASTKNFLRRVNPMTFKTAALATCALLKRKTHRDEAVLSRRLVENTFLFSNSFRKNDNIDNKLDIAGQNCSSGRPRSSTDLTTDRTDDGLKLPAINLTNSVMRAASDERIQKRSRHKPQS
ncbi:myosin light chain kinase A-like [Clytia hemisphaerica]|uniref:Protein kinase domain-containing protein n=1 Tax=Clytia hemisphaerica TaxID=252671 RepID=A0A7M5U6W1_9CNID|eukprot:TCONS_00024169-protein